MTGRMQMLVDEVWVDLLPAVKFEPTIETSTPEHPDDAEALRDRLTPEPTSWSMSFDVTGDSRETFEELIARLEHEALLARWRARWWLAHPYNPKPLNGC